jgi:hypothetical protein
MYDHLITLPSESRRTAKRANYSKEVTEILNEWLDDHIHYPYPAEDERIIF